MVNSPSKRHWHLSLVGCFFYIHLWKLTGLAGKSPCSIRDMIYLLQNGSFSIVMLALRCVWKQVLVKHKLVLMARLLKDQPVGPWGHHVKKDCQGLLIALTPLKINTWFKRRFPSWKPITFRWTHSFSVQSTRTRVVIAGKVWIASTYGKEP